MTQARSRRGALPAQAVIAGIIGGIIVDAFLSIKLHISPVAVESNTATTVAGAGASPLLGAALHFTIAIVWAALYAYVFHAIDMLRNWIVGAIVLGIVVDAVMNLLITLKTGAPWGSGFVDGLITNVVFYALPVALYLARTANRSRRPSPSGGA